MNLKILPRAWRSLIMISTIGFLLQISCLTTLFAHTIHAQAVSVKEMRISLELHNHNLEEFLHLIEQETGLTFVYQKSLIRSKRNHFRKYEAIPLYDVLLELSEIHDLSFKRVDNVVSIKKRKSSKKPVEEIISDREVEGKVSDKETGQPLAGATVRVKGTNIGTVTDVEGNFRLRIEDMGPGIKLVVTFVGYKTQEIEISAQRKFNVAMSPDLTSLEELVVIGYGEQRQDLLVANIEKLEAEEFANQTNIGPNQALQGRLPGVFITNTSGSPGGGSEVRIRGVNSIVGGNEPLYVIDGVPVTTGDLASRQFGELTRFSGDLDPQSSDILSSINPRDIQSIEVLKDAAAKAIYGTRAANGAILITTKTGKGKPRVSLSTQQGVSQVINRFDLLNTAEWIEIQRESYTNDGLDIPEFIENIDPSIDTDWQDLVYREAFFQEYQVSFSGAKDNVNYYLSGSYRDEDGVMKNNDLQRTTVRLNLDLKLNDKLTVGTRSTLGFTNGNQQYGGISSLSNAVQAVNNFLPFLTPRNENGEFTESPGFDPNPVAIIEESQNAVQTLKIVSNTFLEYQVVDPLTFKTSFSYDFNSFREDIFHTPNTDLIAAFDYPNGYRSNGYRQIATTTVEPQLSYSDRLDNHGVDFTVGTTFLNQDINFQRVTGTDFSNDNTNYINSAATIINEDGFTGSGKEGYAFFSIFARGSYDYDGKYLLSATFRRDGSSRFGPEFRFGNFWSVGAGWNFYREDFAKKLPWISSGKIRASYGVTGNDQLGNYPYLGFWENGGSYIQQPTLVQAQLENEDLQWETRNDLDIGLELGLFENRVLVNGSYFNSLTKNLLLSRPLSQVTGFRSFTENIGEIRNEGWEVDLNLSLIDTDDWSFSLGGNITFGKSTVVRLLNNQESVIAGPLSLYRLTVGEPVNAFNIILFDKIDPETGDIVWVDLDEDGIINRSEDATGVGNPNPRRYGGFHSYLRWKNLSLDLNFQFVSDIDIYRSDEVLSTRFYGTQRTNAQNVFRNRWRNPGDITDIPRVSQLSFPNNRIPGSNNIEDGSYLRLKNITLRYDLPIRSLKAQAYLTGYNLLTFTNYGGVDPEVNANGLARNDYPQVKRYVLGLNFNF